MLTLAITGFEADPTTISEILGIQPTALAHRGVVSLPSRKPKTFNGWFHDAHPAQLSNGADHDTALEIIIDRLRGREERFARLRQEVRPESVGIYAGFHFRTGEQAGVWLDASQMRVLADCEIEWGLDLFVRPEG
jgi:hypothetical protein